MAASEPAGRTQRRGAICDAAYELLAKVGYDKLTMDAVATRARASKATIYRIWSNKPTLVCEALTRRFAQDPELPDTGSLRGDLLALTEGACASASSEDGEVMAGIITAAAHDAELSRILRANAFESKLELHRAIFERAAARGELRLDNASVEIMHEVMHAMLTSRKLTSHEPLDADFARHVVDDVLMPLLKSTTAGANL